MIIPIDECDSCRELDAKIATCMGLECRFITRGSGYLVSEYDQWYIFDWRPHGWELIPLPRYSENLQAAYNVLDYFIDKDDGTTFIDISALFPGSGDAAHWEVKLNGNEEWVGTGNTQALAICIAFLKANGVDGIER